MAKLGYEPRLPCQQSLRRHLVKRVLAGLALIPIGIMFMAFGAYGALSIYAAITLDDSSNLWRWIVQALVGVGSAVMLMNVIYHWGRFCLLGTEVRKPDEPP